MPRLRTVPRLAILSILALPVPAAFALAIEDITGVWEVSSVNVFGQHVGGSTRNRITIAVTNGTPLCLVQLGKNETVTIAIEQWESQGADQATARVTQLVPSGEVATYAVERVETREVRFTATSGTNTGQIVSLAKGQSVKPRPPQPGDGAPEGKDMGGGRQTATPAAKEAKSGLIARLSTELTIERKKLATAQANLRNQLEHGEGAAGGRRVEYDAVVAERRDAVRLHRTRIDEICDKLEELGVDTGTTKERKR